MKKVINIMFVVSAMGVFAFAFTANAASFRWETSDWTGSCPENTCAVQKRDVWCEKDGEKVSDDLCDLTTKPYTHKQCRASYTIKKPARKIPVNREYNVNILLGDQNSTFTTGKRYINVPYAGTFKTMYYVERGNTPLSNGVMHCQCKESFISWANGQRARDYIDHGGSSCERQQYHEWVDAGTFTYKKGSNKIYAEHMYKNNDQMTCDGKIQTNNSVTLKKVRISGTVTIPGKEKTIYCTNTCGDGYMTEGEQCDDGNTKSGDGCSATCKVEVPTSGITINKNDNDNGDDKQTVKEGKNASFKITVKNTGKRVLTNVVINDQKVSDCNRSASETQKLYKGNLFDPGESFSYTCVDKKVTKSYTNIATIDAKTTDGKDTVSDKDATTIIVKKDEVQNPVCGNGIVEKGEQCDDGNATSGDGCSATCTIESQPQPQPQPEEKEEKEDKDGAIGNFVWHDRNRNCIQDEGEEGIPGVRLKLYNGDKVKKDTTNSQGRYKFKGLKKGSYKVVVAQETLPEGCYQVCDPDGTKMDGKTHVKIKGDQYYRKADFGYYCQATQPLAETSPRTGAGATTGAISFVAAAISAGYVYKRNKK